MAATSADPDLAGAGADLADADLADADLADADLADAGLAGADLTGADLAGAGSGSGSAGSRVPAAAVSAAGARRRDVQRWVHDRASLQYQRRSAHASPPSGTISPIGCSRPHREHFAACKERVLLLRCAAESRSDEAYAAMVPPHRYQPRCPGGSGEGDLSRVKAG
ncbi:MAG: pentapeptide repeat-containing protein [Streptosporangiaceae bacterium]